MISIEHLFGHARAGVLVPLHIAVALWVTLHAMLHKRDVGAALGWIGLAWLAPFIGGLFYFVAGINRVRRRAERLNRRPRTRTRPSATIDRDKDDDLEPLQRGIGRISRRPLETGNRLVTYQNGDEAYPAMLAAIAAAKTSVGLSSYIFREDFAGRKFIAALKSARSRGLDVRVIIDGVGGGWIRSPAYEALKAADVPVGRFLHSPLPWRMPLVNLRSHKKILVVDGQIGFNRRHEHFRRERVGVASAPSGRRYPFQVGGPGRRPACRRVR